MPRASSRVSMVLGILLCGAATTAPAQPSVPEALEGWQDWALHGQEHRRCPFVASADPADASSYRCAWPEKLVIALDTRGGRFSQRWQVFAPSWIVLPGNLERWPRNLRIDGAPLATVAREGRPQARLSPGSHVLTGEFAWAVRPEALPISPQTALVELSIDGVRVAQPERPGGALWLGKRRSAEEPAQVQIHVYRLVEDDVPVRLVTRLRLQVAGEGREELLARVLPQGFTPLALNSPLAARLEPDGRLRLQVRPGSFELTLTARGAGAAATLQRPSGAGGLWASEEIWSFRGIDRLRIAAAEGVEGIDPARADVPSEWRGFPAFRMTPDATLRVVERSRGLSAADENRLTLSRRLWLDFDHHGYTALDSIRGTMRRDWRLDAAAPYELAGARSEGESLLITEGAEPGVRGVELRSPNVNLDGLLRTQGSRGALPATGWLSRFESVEGRLFLPPGHRLIVALSDWADVSSGSWWSQWGLWSFFGVCLVVAFTFRLGGAFVAAIAAGGLLLMYHEGPAYIWLWANLLAAVALLRVVPQGRLRRWALAYRLASFIVLGMALLPFLWGQLRLALHPQLEGAGLLPIEEIVAPAGHGTVATDVTVEEAKRAELEVKTEQPVSAPPPAAPPGILDARGELRRASQYAPGTLLQTGPGVPSWRYRVYHYRWSGPVEPLDTLRIVFVGPLVLAAWRIVGVVLLAAWFAWLLSLSFGMRTPVGWARKGGTSAVAAALLLAFSCAPPAVQAQGTPDPRLLEQLTARLTQAPQCVPSCADIVAASVEVAEERLAVEITASALTNVALAIPHAGDRWQISSASLDGNAGLAVARDRDGSLWVPLRAGVHRIRLAGQLAPVESVQLAFPQPPRSISVTVRGWQVAGVGDGRLLAGSLELARRRTAVAAIQPLESGSEFPPFVRVERSITLDTDWRLETVVKRVAPERAAINVEVPLLEGESVLDEDVEVVNGRAQVALAPGQAAASWRSGLARGEAILLTLPADAARGELWSFLVSPQWRVRFEGPPAVLPEDLASPAWAYQYFPRPGETLKAIVSQPAAAAGPTLAIDSVHHALTVGARTSDASLQFSYRSTQGGRHAIRLPPGARVQMVSVDGSPVQLRPENDELSIGLLPGEHSVDLSWQSAVGAGLSLASEAVDLRAPASNVTTRIELPADRWPLLKFTRGAGVGPAILYWSELVAFLVLAALLGRWAVSPLKTHEWLLLGIGLSTLSWGIFVMVALWLFALQWRSQWKSERAPRWTFNLAQIVLAIFTIVALSGLIFSGIRYGFLSTPDMGVVGPGSGGNTFSWLADQTDSALPRPSVISVPLWIYKTLVLAWAFWIAYALAMRWLPWAWRAWSTNGYWRASADAIAGPASTASRGTN